MSFTSVGQRINHNNRLLQRKGKAIFQHGSLPVITKRTTEILAPVSPTLARVFQARTESNRKRTQMATGLLLILVLGVSAAVILALLGMM